MIIGGKEFEENRTHIMGILNITPDSFSDGGRYNKADSALFHVQEMVKEGAEIIDVGGESTRPGYKATGALVEMERIIPVIRKIKSEFDIPVSVDTFRLETALEAYKTGIDLLNYVKGYEIAGEYGHFAAETGLPICIMHNRTERAYDDFKTDYFKDCASMYDLALSVGISPKRSFSIPV